jgi:hypothetical protein
MIEFQIAPHSVHVLYIYNTPIRKNVNQKYGSEGWRSVGADEDGFLKWRGEHE